MDKREILLYIIGRASVLSTLDAKADFILTALKKYGLVIVPREPTEEMLDATLWGHQVHPDGEEATKYLHQCIKDDAKKNWEAMVEVADE